MSCLLGLAGFGLVIMMMMDFFSMHKHSIPYMEKGHMEFWLHTMRIMTMMMDLMTMTHLSSQDSRELTQLSAVQFMEVSALLATWRRFKSF